MMTPVELAAYFREGRHPHNLVKTLSGVLWECISYPYPTATTAHVMIRVPGDPTTIRSVECHLVHPENHRTAKCGCEHGEFYFREREDRAQQRAEEIARWEAMGCSFVPSAVNRP